MKPRVAVYRMNGRPYTDLYYLHASHPTHIIDFQFCRLVFVPSSASTFILFQELRVHSSCEIVRTLLFGWFRKGSRISCFLAVIFLHKLGVLVLSYYYRVLEVCGTSCCRKKSSYIRKDFLSLIEFPSRMGLLGKVIRARIKFQGYYWSVVPNRTKIRSFCLLSSIDRKCTSCIRWFSSKITQNSMTDQRKLKNLCLMFVLEILWQVSNNHFQKWWFVAIYSSNESVNSAHTF